MANYREDFANINLETGTISRNFMNHSIGGGDAMGDRFGVRVFRNNEAVTLGGTCAGYFVRNTTGETVVITDGVVSGNEAYVTLPAACYAVEGSFTLAIKVTVDSEIVTLRIVDGVVDRTNTSVVVDPGDILPSIEDLLQAIEDAVESIPADYSSLWTSLAPVFSTSTAYKAGQYVTYDGKLWRFTTDHAAGAWNAAHATQVNVGGDMSDLKSALSEESSNLISIHFESMPKNGISAVAKTDGIHMTGTSTDPTNITRLWISDSKQFAAGTYTFGVDEDIGFGTKLSVYAFNVDTTPLTTLAGTNTKANKTTFTLEASTNVRFALQITKSANVNGAIVKPMCVSGSSLPSYYLPAIDAVDHYARNSAYEANTKVDATSQYVTEMEQSIIEETENLIKIDFEDMPKNGISAVSTHDGIHVSGVSTDPDNITRLWISKAKVFPAGTYTFGVSEYIGFGTRLSAYAFNVDATPASTLAGANTVGNNTFTLAAATTVRFALQITKGADVDGAIVKPMCVEGTALPEYYIPGTDAVDHYARNNIVSDTISVPVYDNFAMIYGAKEINSIEIKPKQSGTGTPSSDNPRTFIPIDDDINLYISGRNIFDNADLYSGYYRQDDPSHLVSSGDYRTIIIEDLPAGSYKVRIKMDHVYIIRTYFDETNTNNPKTDNTYSITTEEDGLFMLTFRPVTGYSFPNDLYVSVERVSDVTDENVDLYNGITNEIQIPNDIIPLYGCRFDLKEGKLNVTHHTMEITGDDVNELHTSVLGVKYVDITCNLSGLNDTGDIYCDLYDPYRQAVGRTSGQMAITAYNHMYIYDERFEDLATAKSILTSDPVTVAYPVKDGDVYYSTPVDTKDLPDDLSIYTDIGEIVKITYSINNQELYSKIEELRKAAQDKNHLNILVFGHSYSSDSWGYVPFILKEDYGITVNLYMYYRGDGSIYRLVQEWNDTGEYGTDEWNVPHIRRLFHVDTRKSDVWDDEVIGYSPKMILELANDPKTGIDHWDVITIQTAPTDVFLVKAATDGSPQMGYEPYVRQAMKLIRESYHKPFALGWFCVYTRILPLDLTGYPPITGEEFDNRVDTLRAAETVCKYESFDFVIPAAAAVFSARTNPLLAGTDVCDLGNLWYRDAIHLQSGVPRYIAALTVIQSLFKKFFPRYSVMGNKTRITTAWLIEKNEPTPGIHGGIKETDHDEVLYRLAQKCAVSACEHPFDITPIYSEDDTTQYDFFDTYQNRYWADDMIDTSNIDNGQIVEPSDEA